MWRYRAFVELRYPLVDGLGSIVVVPLNYQVFVLSFIVADQALEGDLGVRILLGRREILIGVRVDKTLRFRLNGRQAWALGPQLALVGGGGVRGPLGAVLVQLRLIELVNNNQIGEAQFLNAHRLDRQP